MTYKKINVKKFFGNFTQNDMISNLFGSCEVPNIPFIKGYEEGKKISKENAEEWYAFYLSLEDESRLSIYSKIEKINYLSNFQAHQIYDSFKIRKSNGEKDLTANEIMAENYFDKAMAFVLDNPENKKNNEELEVADLSGPVEKVIHVYSFYKNSGYKRFEAEGNVLKNIKSLSDDKSSDNEDFKKSKDNFKQIDSALEERFENILEAQNGVYVKVNSKTLEYDNMYFTKISYQDLKEKELFFVYIKDSKEVILKAAGSKQIVFEYAENYMKKLTGYAMNPKEPNYDINIFIDKNCKESLANESSKINLKYPLDNDNIIYDWYVKSIKLSRKVNSISFNFTKSDEMKNMLPLYATLAESNIDINTYNIESLSVVCSVKINTNNINKVGKKNISLSIKTNSTNLNILKKEHRELDKLLKDKKIFTGYKVIEMKSPANKN